ncbi:MAG: hypothetical protein U9P07_12750 [Pseudomonadota bacterium]|nr:hypothetical protein [Pseudomonadota bacterium]
MVIKLSGLGFPLILTGRPWPAPRRPPRITVRVIRSAPNTVGI